MSNKERLTPLEEQSRKLDNITRTIKLVEATLIPGEYIVARGREKETIINE